MTFDLLAYRFTFQARDRVRFGQAANTFRGALGHILRRIASRPDYVRVFEPAVLGGPSGLADAPRPFVIRAAALDGRSFAPGDEFSMDVHVFDPQANWLEHLSRAFDALAREGIGPGRAAVQLKGVKSTPIQLSLDPLPDAPAEISLWFVTPTELKGEGQIATDAPFGLVFARARDRISTLRLLYGGGPLELDFRAMGERAAAVRTVASDLRWESARRRSSRTGQTHPLGGFVGEVRYAGELAEFLPFLKAAYWTGIGRQTTWGKGVIEVTLPPAPAVP